MQFYNKILITLSIFLFFKINQRACKEYVDNLRRKLLALEVKLDKLTADNSYHTDSMKTLKTLQNFTKELQQETSEKIFDFLNKINVKQYYPDFYISIERILELFQKFGIKFTKNEKVNYLKRPELAKIAKLIFFDSNNIIDYMLAIRKGIEDDIYLFVKNQLNWNDCNGIYSQNQMLKIFHNIVNLVELKGYFLIRLSNIILKINRSELKGKRTELPFPYYNLPKFNDNIMHSLETGTSLEIRNCDPTEHVQGQTYEELTGIDQGYIENLKNLINETNTEPSCERLKSTFLKQCSPGSLCEKQRTCKGRIHTCKNYIPEGNLCLSSPDSSRRYDHNCKYNENIFNNWNNLTSKKNRYCFCHCDEENNLSDRYFSLQPTISNLSRNNVVVGLRFIKDKRVFHLQIQEGELLPYGQINPSSVRWVPVKTIDVDDKKTDKKLYHTLSENKKKLDLDDVHADPYHILTGVKLQLINDHLKLVIYTTPYNYTGGELIDPFKRSSWKFSSKMSIVDSFKVAPKLATKSTEESVMGTTKIVPTKIITNREATAMKAPITKLTKQTSIKVPFSSKLTAAEKLTTSREDKTSPDVLKSLDTEFVWLNFLDNKMNEVPSYFNDLNGLGDLYPPHSVFVIINIDVKSSANQKFRRPSININILKYYGCDKNLPNYRLSKSGDINIDLMIKNNSYCCPASKALLQSAVRKTDIMDYQNNLKGFSKLKNLKTPDFNQWLMEFQTGKKKFEISSLEEMKHHQNIYKKLIQNQDTQENKIDDQFEDNDNSLSLSAFLRKATDPLILELKTSQTMIRHDFKTNSKYYFYTIDLVIQNEGGGSSISVTQPKPETVEQSTPSLKENEHTFFIPFLLVNSKNSEQSFKIPPFFYSVENIEKREKLASQLIKTRFRRMVIMEPNTQTDLEENLTINVPTTLPETYENENVTTMDTNNTKPFLIDESRILWTENSMKTDLPTSVSTTTKKEKVTDTNSPITTDHTEESNIGTNELLKGNSEIPTINLATTKNLLNNTTALSDEQQLITEQLPKINKESWTKDETSTTTIGNNIVSTMNDLDVTKSSFTTTSEATVKNLLDNSKSYLDEHELVTKLFLKNDSSTEDETYRITKKPENKISTIEDTTDSTVNDLVGTESEFTTKREAVVKNLLNNSNSDIDQQQLITKDLPKLNVDKFWGKDDDDDYDKNEFTIEISWNSGEEEDVEQGNEFSQEETITFPDFSVEEYDEESNIKLYEDENEDEDTTDIYKISEDNEVEPAKFNNYVAEDGEENTITEVDDFLTTNDEILDTTIKQYEDVWAEDFSDEIELEYVKNKLKGNKKESQSSEYYENEITIQIEPPLSTESKYYFKIEGNQYKWISESNEYETEYRRKKRETKHENVKLENLNPQQSLFNEFIENQISQNDPKVIRERIVVTNNMKRRNKFGKQNLNRTTEEQEKFLELHKQKREAVTSNNKEQTQTGSDHETQLESIKLSSNQLITEEYAAIKKISRISNNLEITKITQLSEEETLRTNGESNDSNRSKIEQEITTILKQKCTTSVAIEEKNENLTTISELHLLNEPKNKENDTFKPSYIETYNQPTDEPGQQRKRETETVRIPGIPNLQQEALSFNRIESNTFKTTDSVMEEETTLDYSLVTTESNTEQTSTIKEYLLKDATNFDGENDMSSTILPKINDKEHTTNLPGSVGSISFSEEGKDATKVVPRQTTEKSFKEIDNYKFVSEPMETSSDLEITTKILQTELSKDLVENEENPQVTKFTTTTLLTTKTTEKPDKHLKEEHTVPSDEKHPSTKSTTAEIPISSSEPFISYFTALDNPFKITDSTIEKETTLDYRLVTTESSKEQTSTIKEYLLTDATDFNDEDNISSTILPKVNDKEDTTKPHESVSGISPTEEGKYATKAVAKEPKEPKQISSDLEITTKILATELPKDLIENEENSQVTISQKFTTSTLLTTKTTEKSPDKLSKEEHAVPSDENHISTKSITAEIQRDNTKYEEKVTSEDNLKKHERSNSKTKQSDIQTTTAILSSDPFNSNFAALDNAFKTTDSVMEEQTTLDYRLVTTESSMEQTSTIKEYLLTDATDFNDEDNISLTILPKVNDKEDTTKPHESVSGISPTEEGKDATKIVAKQPKELKQTNIDLEITTKNLATELPTDLTENEEVIMSQKLTTPILLATKTTEKSPDKLSKEEHTVPPDENHISTQSTTAEISRDNSKYEEKVTSEDNLKKHEHSTSKTKQSDIQSTTTMLSSLDNAFKITNSMMKEETTRDYESSMKETSIIKEYFLTDAADFNNEDNISSTIPPKIYDKEDTTKPHESVSSILPTAEGKDATKVVAKQPKEPKQTSSDLEITTKNLPTKLPKDLIENEEKSQVTMSEKCTTSSLLTTKTTEKSPDKLSKGLPTVLSDEKHISTQSTTAEIPRDNTKYEEKVTTEDNVKKHEHSTSKMKQSDIQTTTAILSSEPFNSNFASLDNKFKITDSMLEEETTLDYRLVTESNTSTIKEYLLKDATHFDDEDDISSTIFPKINGKKDTTKPHESVSSISSAEEGKDATRVMAKKPKQTSIDLGITTKILATELPKDLTENEEIRQVTISQKFPTTTLLSTKTTEKSPDKLSKEERTAPSDEKHLSTKSTSEIPRDNTKYQEKVTSEDNLKKHERSTSKTKQSDIQTTTTILSSEPLNSNFASLDNTFKITDSILEEETTLDYRLVNESSMEETSTIKEYLLKDVTYFDDEDDSSLTIFPKINDKFHTEDDMEETETTLDNRLVTDSSIEETSTIKELKDATNFDDDDDISSTIFPKINNKFHTEDDVEETETTLDNRLVTESSMEETSTNKELKDATNFDDDDVISSTIFAKSDDKYRTEDDMEETETTIDYRLVTDSSMEETSTNKELKDVTNFDEDDDISSTIFPKSDNKFHTEDDMEETETTPDNRLVTDSSMEETSTIKELKDVTNFNDDDDISSTISNDKFHTEDDMEETETTLDNRLVTDSSMEETSTIKELKDVTNFDDDDDISSTISNDKFHTEDDMEETETTLDNRLVTDSSMEETSTIKDLKDVTNFDDDDDISSTISNDKFHTQDDMEETETTLDNRLVTDSSMEETSTNKELKDVTNFDEDDDISSTIFPKNDDKFHTEDDMDETETTIDNFLNLTNVESEEELTTESIWGGPRIISENRSEEIMSTRSFPYLFDDSKLMESAETTVNEDLLPISENNSDDATDVSEFIFIISDELVEDKTEFEFFGNRNEKKIPEIEDELKTTNVKGGNDNTTRIKSEDSLEERTLKHIPINLNYSDEVIENVKSVSEFILTISDELVKDKTEDDFFGNGNGKKAGVNYNNNNNTTRIKFDEISEEDSSSEITSDELLVVISDEKSKDTSKSGFFSDSRNILSVEIPVSDEDNETKEFSYFRRKRSQIDSDSSEFLLQTLGTKFDSTSSSAEKIGFGSRLKRFVPKRGCQTRNCNNQKLNIRTKRQKSVNPSSSESKLSESLYNLSLEKNEIYKQLTKTTGNKKGPLPSAVVFESENVKANNKPLSEIKRPRPWQKRNKMLKVISHQRKNVNRNIEQQPLRKVNKGKQIGDNDNNKKQIRQQKKIGLYQRNQTRHKRVIDTVAIKENILQNPYEDPQLKRNQNQIPVLKQDFQSTSIFKPKNFKETSKLKMSKNNIAPFSNGYQGMKQSYYNTSKLNETLDNSFKTKNLNLMDAHQNHSNLLNKNNFSAKPFIYVKLDEDEHTIDLTPTKSSQLNTPDYKMFVEFTSSDVRKDKAQTTIPFIDIQPVEMLIPQPLQGAGIYFNGYSGYGGFIALKIFTTDFGTYIDLNGW